MSEIIGRWTLNDASTLYGEAGWHLDGGPIVLDWMPACEEGCEEGTIDDDEHYDCCWSLYGWPGRLEADPVGRYLPEAMRQVEREWDNATFAALAAHP
jgi:hypothetical protein